ncbi:adenylate/guanylate cyclase domain-containing protein [Roseibium salinum]|uniref:adenylate/guanylate cyclase domain-containing protein n=1 Tax=Roseibium salinum TaxID=1604349 RepID=UPI002B05ED83|nr:adenylate/guanylate cyclase domain-containing protein [Roseibium sp. DSM 29163]
MAELAAQICGCPVAYIGFMDDDRMWLKSKYGLPPDFNSCPREIAFCTTTVCGTELVVSPDLREDQRFNQLPFVTGEPYLKFYCGMPLINDEGYALGTLCVMDFEPHKLAFEQIEAVRRLSHQVLTQLELRRKLIEFDTAVRELDEARTEVVAEKRRTDELLANILPAAIADELKRSGKVQPKYASSATILFADFKNFSLLAERVEPAALVGTLDQYFTAFDEIIARHGLEKIKTIGDAYMAVAGVPATSRHHPFDACLAALDIEATMARIGAQRQKLHLPSLELRIGLHTGPVISGVVGRRRFTFDIWGDAVNTAALMEENGAPGRINASETVASYVRTLFELEPRDAIRTKHGRQLEMFFLNRIRPELSRDAEGRLPNEKFATECARLLTGFSAA